MVANQPSTHEVFGRQLASLVRPRIGPKEPFRYDERSPVITGLITVVSPPYTDIRKALLLDIFYRMRRRNQERYFLPRWQSPFWPISAASPPTSFLVFWSPTFTVRPVYQSFHSRVIHVYSSYRVLTGCRAQNLVIHFYRSEIQSWNS